MLFRSGMAGGGWTRRFETRQVTHPAACMHVHTITHNSKGSRYMVGTTWPVVGDGQPTRLALGSDSGRCHRYPARTSTAWFLPTRVCGRRHRHARDGACRGPSPRTRYQMPGTGTGPPTSVVETAEASGGGRCLRPSSGARVHRVHKEVVQRTAVALPRV